MLANKVNGERCDEFSSKYFEVFCEGIAFTSHDLKINHCPVKLESIQKTLKNLSINGNVIPVHFFQGRFEIYH